MNDALQSLWKLIPDIKCRGKCQESCGVIPMQHGEFALIRDVTPRSFVTEIDGYLLMFDKAAKKCPHLSAAGRCAVYERRPLICRLWGVVKAMRCPWGCRPKRWLKEYESREILERARVESMDITRCHP